MSAINFDRPTLEALKQEYDKAVKEGKETFTFQGQELLVSYARYLIEYLQTKLR